MIKVIDIENIKIGSVNGKYQVSRSTGRLYLCPEYRTFQQAVAISAMKYRIQPPYEIFIELETAADIDNPIKPILDALQKAGIIDNDSNVLDLRVLKRPIPRGRSGALRVHVATMEVPR